MTLHVLVAVVAALGAFAMCDSFGREPERHIGTACFGAACAAFVTAAMLAGLATLPGSSGLAVDGLAVAVGCLCFTVAALYHGVLER